MSKKMTEEQIQKLKFLKKISDDETTTVSFRVPVKLKNKFQTLKKAANKQGLTFDFQETMVAAYTRTVSLIEKELQVIGMTKEDIEEPAKIAPPGDFIK